LHAKHQPLKTLQERVVQLARDPHTLADAFLEAHVEFSREPIEAEAIEAPEQAQKRGGAGDFEPSGLIVRWIDGEIEGCAGFIPHPAVIAGRHAEAVVAWSKVAIERLPASAGVLPIAIPAFQFVPEAGCLRRCEAESGVVDLQIADPRRQTQIRRPVVNRVVKVSLVVGGDLFDLHRRGKEGRKIPRIEDAHATSFQEPKLPIRGFGNARTIAGDGVRPESGSVEYGRLNLPVRIGSPRV
jgi:hypothetical protein